MNSPSSSESSQHENLANWQAAMAALAQEVQRIARGGVVDAGRLRDLRAVVETTRLAFEGFGLRRAEG